MLRFPVIPSMELVKTTRQSERAPPQVMWTVVAMVAARAAVTTGSSVAMGVRSRARG